MTRAVERLSIDWPAESEDVRSKSRFDERFSCTTSTPGIDVFFPDLHTEIMGENGFL